MARKRQKLEVIRHPQNFKVEEEDVAEAPQQPAEKYVLDYAEDEAEAVCAAPQEEEGDGDKQDEDEEDEGEELQQGGPHAALSATLVASPVYPNAVKWSDDNLIAVATSQLITILNPALIDGPRGFVTASSGQSFVVGTVQLKDIDASCLFPIRLSKDVRAVVRSMDWSPQGLAPNGGCLLAVCTKDHRVKLYRAPHYEYQCEWVQVLDISEMMYRHNFKGGCKVTQQEEIRLATGYHVQATSGSTESNDQLSYPHGTSLEHEQQSHCEGKTTNDLAMVPFDSSLSAGIQSKFVMDSEHYVRYTNVLSYVSVAWSPAIRLASLSNSSLKGMNLTMAFIALGAKSGEVSVLRCIQPAAYTLDKVTSTPEVSLVAIIKAHESWVSAMSWSTSSKTIYNGDDSSPACVEEFFLITGSSDGSVKLWGGEVNNFTGAPTSSVPLMLLRKVVAEDHALVTSIALMIPVQPTKCIQIAVGKASGSIITIEVHREEDYQHEAFKSDAHMQAVTGLLWAFDGRCLYSCSQDNSLYAWKLTGSSVLALPFPEESIRKIKGKVILPNSVLDGYYGLALSKGSLALATVRGVSAELLDQMYESRAMKAVAQVFWVGSQQFDALPNPTTPGHGVKFCNQLDTICIQWELNLLAALHHFENISGNLVLWDITSCFTYVASTIGRKFLNSVVSNWLLSLGLVHSVILDDNFGVSLESHKESLSNASCRRLQIVYVIVKRLFECPENSWHTFLLDVEHELRERLVLLTISSTILRLQKCSATSKDDELVGCSGVICMVQWVAANSLRVSSQLLDYAQMIGRNLEGCAEAELCSTCKAKVSFVSAELGECQGDHPHKLPRCSVSFELCPPDALWFCNCCARRAFKQTPRIFVTSSSRQSLSKLESPALLQDQEPTCPYCGILMQRYLPDCFLRLTLI
eukprot:c13489_g1_i1 orf=522-3281(-)